MKKVFEFPVVDVADFTTEDVLVEWDSSNAMEWDD